MIPDMKFQESLVARKLAIKKVNEELGLVTYKYARKVHYDNLWAKENVFETRGHTYDISTGELVLAAPRKSFNYLENNWWGNVKPNEPVTVYKKRNGYMATATIHKGNLVVGTTGTTNSDYAKWAYELLSNVSGIEENFTSLFEIVVPQDPHIVAEPYGVHSLGYRCNEYHDYIASEDQIVGDMTLRDAIALQYEDKGEGFMVYTRQDYLMNEPCKLKTPHYIGKKLLMRITENNWKSVVNDDRHIRNRLDARWHPVLSHLLTEYKDTWYTVPEQERRNIIENLGVW